MDVEPLLLFTARLADADPRLRDESIRWIVGHHRYVSRARLRALLSAAADAAQTAAGPYLATVALSTPGTWPAAGEPWPRAVAVRDPQRPRPFDAPSLVRLRLRALLGVGARAEIAHAFVARPDARFAASELSELSAFTRSNINQELEAFTLARLLERSSSGKRLVYRLSDPQRLLAFAGPRPAHFPDWAASLEVLGVALDLLELSAGASHLAASVEAARFLDANQVQLDRAAFPRRPPQLFGEDLWEWLVSAAIDYAAAISAGRVPQHP
jgi:hypothetical protein